MDKASNQIKKAKKERSGRWSNAEADLFQELIERYGKNWKVIQQHMRGRTLSQIRSHAQKFFDKVGTKKVHEYERKAKLIQAYETLEKEKRLQNLEDKPSSDSQEVREASVKKEQAESPQQFRLGDEQSLTTLQYPAKEAPKELSIKVEQKIEEEIIKRQSIGSMLYPMTYDPSQNGFLMHLICLNPDAFSQYGLGLEEWCSRQVAHRPYYFQNQQK